jgi:hypothetical protein
MPDGIIRNPDEADLDGVDRAADAHAVALFAQGRVSVRISWLPMEMNGDRFGGAVGGLDFSILHPAWWENWAMFSGDTGAPAEKTRRREGSLTFWPCRSCPTRFSRAGEANMLVTPWLRIASMMRRGLTWAGRVGSMSGITAVTPRAGQKRANRGKVDRSISSVVIDRWVLIWRSWASKLPWV